MNGQGRHALVEFVKCGCEGTVAARSSIKTNEQMGKRKGRDDSDSSGTIHYETIAILHLAQL